MKRFGHGPHVKAVCAAGGLWSLFGKTVVAWRKNTVVPNGGETWEGTLQMQALPKPAKQPGIPWKVFGNCRGLCTRLKVDCEEGISTSSPRIPPSKIQLGSCKHAAGVEQR